MSNKNYLFAFVLLFIWCVGCTPKVVEEVVKEEPKPAVNQPDPNEKLSPCPNFYTAPNPDEAETNYVLYRDFMKQQQWQEAYGYWQKVYEVAPAADGRRNTVMADGIRFYEYFMSQATDETEKAKYIDQVYEMYDKIDECYPDGGYVKGRKAFDYFYKYPDRSTKEETYAMFKKSMDEDGVENAQYFILNPMASLMVDLYFDDKIALEEVKQYEQNIRTRLAKGLEDCTGKGCEKWKIIEEYIPERFEAFERIKGFYDCDYYKEKYYGEFLAAQDDCEKVVEVYSRLKFAGCDETDEQFKELIRVGNENCAPEPGPGEVANNCLRNAEYQCAIDNYQIAASEATDPQKKAKYTLIIAKIYNAHLKNFPKAREFALQAAEIDPNWGEPHILIGRLYASSGPLCGSGRGWNSQIVVWAAIDAWNKAKRVDSSVKAEANKWIGRYSQYMPNKEDIFQRNLQVGDSYRIPCWIQRTTTIRAAP